MEIVKKERKKMQLTELWLKFWFDYCRISSEIEGLDTIDWVKMYFVIC